VYPSFKFFVDSFSIPADPIGAAGTQSLVAVVNNNIGLYNKATGAIISANTLQTFFQPFAGTFDPFDPKVVYDKHANRFVVVALVVDLRNPSLVPLSKAVIAVSKTSTPADLTSASWWSYEINTLINNNWGDYPGWEVDANYLYLTLNMFTANRVFDEARLWAIEKAGFYSGGTLVFKNSVSPTSLFKQFGAQTTVMPAEIRGSGLGGTTGTFIVTAAFTDSSLGIVDVTLLTDPSTLDGSGLLPSVGTSLVTSRAEAAVFWMHRSQ
jgi:hypothetical protein